MTGLFFHRRAEVEATFAPELFEGRSRVLVGEFGPSDIRINNVREASLSLLFSRVVCGGFVLLAHECLRPAHLPACQQALSLALEPVNSHNELL